MNSLKAVVVFAEKMHCVFPLRSLPHCGKKSVFRYSLKFKIKIKRYEKDPPACFPLWKSFGANPIVLQPFC